jgi:hypothetical protein
MKTWPEHVVKVLITCLELVLAELLDFLLEKVWPVRILDLSLERADAASDLWALRSG